MVTTHYSAFGVQGLGLYHTPPIMGNQMDKKMENNMEAGVI